MRGTAYSWLYMYYITIDNYVKCTHVHYLSSHFLNIKVYPYYWKFFGHVVALTAWHVSTCTYYGILNPQQQFKKLHMFITYYQLYCLAWADLCALSSSLSSCHYQLANVVWKDIKPDWAYYTYSFTYYSFQNFP